MGRSHKATKVYIFRVQIRIDSWGRGGVFDMMRYDSCCPDSEKDSMKLIRVAAGENSYTGSLAEDRTLWLRMFGLSSKGPTVARWRSFGVEILQVEPEER